MLKKRVCKKCAKSDQKCALFIKKMSKIDKYARSFRSLFQKSIKSRKRGGWPFLAEKTRFWPFFDPFFWSSGARSANRKKKKVYTFLTLLQWRGSDILEADKKIIKPLYIYKGILHAGSKTFQKRSFLGIFSMLFIKEVGFCSIDDPIQS